MKLFFIGDSFLTGYSVKEEESWFNMVSEMSMHVLINKSSVCQTTSDVLVHFHEEVIAEKPDFVFITAGMNDALNRRTANIIFHNVMEMINLSIDNGIVPIIMLQPLPYVDPANAIFGEDGEKYRAALNIKKRYRRLIADYCQDENIELIDFDTVIPDLESEDKASLYFRDGVHLTPCAHALVAQKFIDRFGYLLQKKAAEDYSVS